MKLVFDKTFAFFGILILIPVYFIIFILIWIKMPGAPAVFKQERIGKGGKRFIMYKFRSMYISHSNSSVSVKGESRITPLGTVLRKYKLDELPELYNVLIGDMSFVGPRPDVPGYADKLEGDNRVVLSIRPGITGPASLKYSNEEEILAGVENPVHYNDTVIYPDKVRLNKNYIKHWSFALDLKIILFTVTGSKLDEPWFQ